MTRAEKIKRAKSWLDQRYRRRLDGTAMGWSLTDAHAVRDLLSHTRDLEARTFTKKTSGIGK